jgi:hypothetical protein
MVLTSWQSLGHPSYKYSEIILKKVFLGTCECGILDK